MPQISITEPWIARVAADEQRGKPAELPEGVAQIRYWDTSLPGFGVVLGRRFATFVVQHRVKGRQTLATIGRWGRAGAGGDHAERWTVARARKEAIRLLGTMAQGHAAAPKRASSALTLRAAFDAHVERLERKGRSEATIATFKKSMAYVEDWLDRPIDELDGEALAKLYEEIKAQARARAGAKNERGAPLANRVITNVGTAWATLNRKLGGKLGNWNPAKSVEKQTLVPRRTRLLDENLPDWFARVQTMRSPIQRDGLVFALFTGLRSEDVRTARFEHADLEARTLRLPDPKGGEARAFTIPLSGTCVEIIERRARDNARDLGRDEGDGGWVFPAVDSNGAVGPIGDLRQQVHATIGTGKKARPTHARFPAESVHDLRRTYASVAQEAGVSELDRHVLTNHKFSSASVHATYIAQHIDHLAKCQATIEAALLAKLKPQPTKGRAKLRAV